MPKQKTHSGATARFRITKRGKVLHRRMNRGHLLEKKSSARKRRLRRDAEVGGADASQVRKLLKR